MAQSEPDDTENAFAEQSVTDLVYQFEKHIGAIGWNLVDYEFEATDFAISLDVELVRERDSVLETEPVPAIIDDVFDTINRETYWKLADGGYEDDYSLTFDGDEAVFEAELLFDHGLDNEFDPEKVDQ